MSILSGAEMIIQSLIDQNVQHIFGYPGGSVLDIYDALQTKKNNIQHILVRHEQGAVHMADGYARATGKVGVVLVTSGPGATNAITGIATAYMDSVPIIIISGQVPSFLIGYDAFQECDMIGISRPIVKHSFLIKNTEDIPKIIQKSFWIAKTGRPGPVVIDVPKDMLTNNNKFPYILPKKVSIRSYNPIINGHIGQIKKALNSILIAKKPVLYIGGGVINSECNNELIKLVEMINFPVTSSLNGLGGFPGTHKQFLGMLGMHGTYEANMSMHFSDLIFAIGVRFDDRTTNNLTKYCPYAKILHIDIDPASISKIIKSDIPIVGDAKQIILEMLKILKNKNFKKINNLNSWWNDINKWQSIKCLHFDNESDIIKPQFVIKKIFHLTAGKAFITSDVGQHQMFTALYYKFDKPRRWINSGGLGTMGFGLPAALGVKLALPKETVICITGDGSIQMNIQELSTALQYNISILIINLNNHCLGMVKQWQDMKYSGRHSHSYMDSLPNFVNLVESYGHIGIAITSKNNLEEKLINALELIKKNHLVFVDIKIDEKEHVYPMQINGGGMNEMWLSKTKKTL